MMGRSKKSILGLSWGLSALTSLTLVVSLAWAEGKHDKSESSAASNDKPSAQHKAMPKKAALAADHTEGEAKRAPRSAGTPDEKTAQIEQLKQTTKQQVRDLLQDPAVQQARRQAIEHYQEAKRAILEARTEAVEGAEKLSAEQKEKLQAAIEQAREELSTVHREATRHLKARSSAEVAQVKQKVAEREKAQEKDRKERAQKRRDAWAKSLGKKQDDPAVREEMREHSWRVARLNQAIFLAKTDERDDLLKRAQELLQRENDAHQARLKRLLERAGSQSGAATTPAAQSKSPPATDKAPTAAPQGAE